MCQLFHISLGPKAVELLPLLAWLSEEDKGSEKGRTLGMTRNNLMSFKINISDFIHTKKVVHLKY